MRARIIFSNSAPTDRPTGLDRLIAEDLGRLQIAPDASRPQLLHTLLCLRVLTRTNVSTAHRVRFTLLIYY